VIEREVRAGGVGRAGWRRGLLAAAAFAFVAASTAHWADAAPVQREDAPVTVSVVVEGALPGFTPDSLVAYVSRQMADAQVTGWRFVPAAAEDSSPNRVVWRFRMLPFADGAVKYLGPAMSRVRDMFGIRRPVSLDAKIYLDGRYQSETFNQATIKGGLDDPELGATIRKMAKQIVANALAQGKTDRADLASLVTRRSARPLKT